MIRVNSKETYKLSESNGGKGFWFDKTYIPLSILLLLLAGSVGYWLKVTQTPRESSADVGFARDMSVHHAQAVEMSTLLYNRTNDDIMKIMAYDILTSQQGQIGIMNGWLMVWGHNFSSGGPRMTWMGMSVEGRMPGMATQTQLNTLSASQDEKADVIFMQLMIPHHRSGVQMAAAAAKQAKHPYVRQLAQNMAEAQESEIAYMQKLLQEKGYAPVPDEPSSTMMIGQ